MATYFKVSIVVPGRKDIGGIQNLKKEPKSGDTLTLGKDKYEIVNVSELMPPRGEFAYLHATCRPAKRNKQKEREARSG
ncbi:MAG TPA: hypothetical protein G4N96_06005 [Chloroflexi bacterium]|nr:hypothetical protein [Chloroflexota bacterium]